MIDLDPEQAKALPVDELGLAVLADFLAAKAWNEYNYLIGVSQDPRYSRDELAVRAISEAFAWCRARGLIARTPNQTDYGAVFVTRAGHRALSEGLAHVRATHRLQEGLHPAIEARARRQFLLGEYEQAVFVAMKAVEVRVRDLGGFGNDAVGVSLMNQAFGPRGPLTDASATGGEQDGTRALFVGAYAVLRNPSGHRDVNYDDVAEAAESVTVASLLMRVLDRVEARLSASAVTPTN